MSGDLGPYIPASVSVGSDGLFRVIEFHPVKDPVHDAEAAILFQSIP